MSILSVNRLCRDVMRDVELRRKLQEAPEHTLSRYPHPLSQAEREALLAGDVAQLYRRGGNSFLMGYLARYKVFGLDMVTYGDRMRGLDDGDE
ncbi:MAG TPA: hypothetical protein VHA77_00160 [Xanthobacteraceae bacterium]|nr:hypothetical protein [Xanthobacteraceae bacterium]